MARPMLNRPASDRGFTLMEILVALTVLALSFTVIMQLISGGLRAQRLSEDYRQAVYLGQAKMEEILLEQKLAPGVVQGNFPGNFGYEAKVTPADFSGKTRSGLFPFQIDLKVSWQEDRRERSLTLSTLHLAEKMKKKDGQ